MDEKEFKLVKVDLRKGEHKHPAFLAKQVLPSLVGWALFVQGVGFQHELVNLLQLELMPIWSFCTSSLL